MGMIGTKVYFRGDEVTITSEPFQLYGGEFMEAVTEDGKKVTVATDAQRQAAAVKHLQCRNGQMKISTG